MPRTSSTHDRALSRLRWSLMTRLGGLLLVFVVLLILGYINTVRLVEQKRFEALMLNVAGQERTLAERYVRQTNLGIVGLSTGDIELLIRERAAANPTGRQFRGLFDVMLNGGTVKIGESTQVLPPADDPRVIAKLKECEGIWEGLERSAIQALRSDNHSLVDNPAVEEIQLASQQTGAVMDDLVTLLLELSDHRFERLLFFQHAFLGTGIGLVVIILVFVYFRIVKPLDQAVQHVRLTNTALTEAKLRADEATRSKSEFLANMSHEIRTPMTAILGFAELLLEHGQSEEIRNTHIKTILHNGQHLLGVINDILDLSKVEAGRMEVESAPCSPWKIVADVAALLRVRAKAKGIELHVDYEFPLPETIESDALRLRQILMNLTGNAIKFTELGEVRIVVRSQGVAAQTPYIEFNIIDTGVGMNAEQMSRLFRSFSQVDSSSTRRFGGTGLGLIISRRLANLLGGDVTVTSEPGRGSTFRLTIPIGALENVKLVHGVHEAMTEPVDEAGPEAAALLQGRVLLAEDGPDNQRLITFVLRKAGLEVEAADDGRLAVEAVTAASAAGRPFDLVLMDMQMPEMDGYQATAELRRLGFTDIPIIALTAHAMASDRDKCIRAGCDDYATKPIERAVLLNMLRKYLDANRRPHAAA